MSRTHVDAPNATVRWVDDIRNRSWRFALTREDVQVAVEMFPAQHGDAFLIRVATDSRSTNVLVDAGPHATYRDVLRGRLVSLAAAGENLRAFIVTHIDADHIEGALAFLEDNGPSASPSVIQVKEVWHNSYRHLFHDGMVPTAEQAARVQQQVLPRVVASTGDISARQGSTLAALLRRHEYAWNAAFNGAAVTTLDGPRKVILDDGISLTLLSPRPGDLAALARLWRRELLSVGVPSDLVDGAAFEESFERMLERESDLADAPDDEATEISARELTEPPPASDFREDRSPPNGSSMAFLLEVGEKRALFLGDAHPSTIAAHLRQLTETPVDLAVLKVSHHGSKKNTSPDFCSTFRTAHALISTDGSKHGHPDIETLLWLVSTQLGITLHFNYPSAASEAISNPDLIRRYGHRVSIGRAGNTVALVL